MTTVEILLGIANEAAEIVRQVYDTPFLVDFKAPEDPVTAADRRANALICGRLAEEFPGVPVVAEESDPASYQDFHSSERVFFVDPLDGTAEFVGKNGEFVVMIGLLEGPSATTGVVVAPAQRVAWIGSPEGAFRVAEDGRKSPVRVSRVATLEQSRVVSSRSHRSPALERTLELLGGTARVAVGSAGLKGARIAEGQAEVYVAPGKAGKRWDSCAVEAIVVAAGGRYTDGRGEPLDYRAQSLENDRGLVVTNGEVHQAVVDCLARLRA